ncbi:perosamine synthetase protein family [Synechococcus sp. BIOS-U3-1]|uniref:DegT/DnrJ/EryC1/StrS family aminotransferase n=1 Tax=Synechococcus sp. BIOS-U3-1 TaxID=1400865 RepID=UPI001645B4F5|nr:DegT/DnrJ/EryC1/StrS family aminotransferase [Synechococcus sp. BIOS-U3-1]QNI59903.1 perosamine synthetase protein family [Synechococcus sp. BIOS-U3-1]
MKIRDTILPVLRPVGGDEEINAIREVIESGWWGKGPKVAQFEKEFAELVGAKYAVAINSATSGQDLVLKALGIKDCDIINPTISFMSTAVIPLWNNCTSNIVDVDPFTMCLDPEDVRKNLKSNTNAIIAVNQAGVPAPIDQIRSFYDGFILEDCAHSCYTPGAGSKGDAAVWSFQAVKTMPCGDGGMITTDDKELYEKLVPMTWLGISSTYSRIKKDDCLSGKPGYSWDYQVDILGYKCYMIDLQAAICLEQMKKLPKHLQIRRRVQKRYNEELAGFIQAPPHSETVQYYCAKVDPEDRDNLISFLAEKNIHTSVHFKPLHLYDIVKNMNQRDYPVADVEWKKLISLPCHPGMNDCDIDYVVYWVKAFFANKYPNRFNIL